MRVGSSDTNGHDSSMPGNIGSKYPEGEISGGVYKACIQTKKHSQTQIVFETSILTRVTQHQPQRSENIP